MFDSSSALVDLAPSPVRLTLDRKAHGSSTPELLFADRAVRLEPFAAVVELPTPLDPEQAIPPRYRITAAHSGHVATLLATGELGGILASTHAESTVVKMSARSRDQLADLVAVVRQHLLKVTDRAGPDSVEVAIWWYSGRHGAMRRTRRLDVGAWASIEANYPGRARTEIRQLMLAGPPTGTGRLILWHGEPGTGKTTAVMALLDAWSSWCAGHLISDPERMFRETDYLHEVLACNINQTRLTLDGRHTPPEWKLLIAEDADEYLRSDARARSGPALGRLLNTSDGILGRGTRTLLLLTTNDELGRLHPAVTRPGRALSVIEFERFKHTEANRWLAGAGIAPASGATLAELYALRDRADRPGVETPAPLATGAYL